MRGKSDTVNLVDRFMAVPGLATAGFKAEQLGRHNIRLSRAGRMLGIWKGTVGAFQWFPTGAAAPQATVLNIEDAARQSLALRV